MRPPGVFKFVEHLENNEKLKEQKSRVKFKIMSLRVKGDIDYIPELFDEQRDQVAVEKILRVVFLDPQHPCSALDKLNRQLAEAEAEAAVAARKKPPEDSGLRIAREGLVIDEWKERRGNDIWLGSRLKALIHCKYPLVSNRKLEKFLNVKCSAVIRQKVLVSLESASSRKSVSLL
ncbi:membrane-associated mannitol-induced [Actinidia rufa]|uniref:Membrane-associated mannitol-induced n=1 Tax=Actinidia rufa TaxID=165716 RepID=A0A7J0G6Y9_9ERIC|nr:membrane-associated mannitol-induced [Actinidia rufa]